MASFACLLLGHAAQAFQSFNIIRCSLVCVLAHVAEAGTHAKHNMYEMTTISNNMLIMTHVHGDAWNDRVKGARHVDCKGTGTLSKYVGSQFMTT